MSHDTIVINYVCNSKRINDNSNNNRTNESTKTSNYDEYKNEHRRGVMDIMCVSDFMRMRYYDI